MDNIHSINDVNIELKNYKHSKIDMDIKLKNHNDLLFDISTSNNDISLIEDSNDELLKFSKLNFYDYDLMIKIYKDKNQINDFGKFLESKYINNLDYQRKLSEFDDKNLLSNSYEIYYKIYKKKVYR